MFGIGNRQSAIGNATWSHPYDIKALKARLAALAADDPLYPLLVGFLDASAVSLADTQVSADDAAHQFVGRMNMLADLKKDLAGLWREAHAK